MKNFCLLMVCAGSAIAAEQEVGLTLGTVLSQSRESGALSLDIASGVALQANYGIRIAGSGGAALYFETHLLASPLRDISSGASFLTRDFASLYLTPGLRVKLLPKAAISPWGAIGAGYAQYEQSTSVIGGGANSAARRVHRGALMFGGGIDGKLWGDWLGWRLEVRDFYTGSPLFNAAVLRGGQHNVVAGGGIVIKWGN